MAITDRRSLELPFERWVASLAEAGVDALQVREKDLEDAALLRLVERARRALRPPTRLLVNGRPDVAVAAGADGVHLPSDGLPAAAVRRRFPALAVGVSTHRVDEVVAAREAGADWVTFGPVYETPSKADMGPPPGLPGLRRAAAEGIAVLALGGVDRGRLAAVAGAGAAGAAGIRMFLDVRGVARAVGEATLLFPGAAA